ncbi:MAG: cell envelope integrity EipB family protein [Beijerinckiaceae bacterium]|nr:cell envelope integrity EipB family protein [Beijerinckiaceae bacterium]MBX9761002.1 cell envelope integrity EipB family protein [Beijerinckiaceae bacterium]
MTISGSRLRSRSPRRSFGLVLLPAILLLSVPALAQDVMPLAPHRAIYDLSLGKSTGTSAPTSARGRIAFDFTGSACDGFVTTFRQMTELQPSEGATRMSDMRSTTWEEGAGKSFRFKIETLVDGRSTETIDGSAQKAADDEAMSIDLKAPRPTRRDVEGSPLFPTDQVRKLIAAARDGKTTFQAKVFDGSATGQKVYDTLTVIAAPATTPPADEAIRDSAMKDMRRWPVVVSYFEDGKPDGAPNYVLSFDLYENGVSGKLKLDYGDFVLEGPMTKLDLMPVKECK